MLPFRGNVVDYSEVRPQMCLHWRAVCRTAACSSDDVLSYFGFLRNREGT